MYGDKLHGTRVVPLYVEKRQAAQADPSLQSTPRTRAPLETTWNVTPKWEHARHTKPGNTQMLFHYMLMYLQNRWNWGNVCSSVMKSRFGNFAHSLFVSFICGTWCCNRSSTTNCNSSSASRIHGDFCADQWKSQLTFEQSCSSWNWKGHERQQPAFASHSAWWAITVRCVRK